MSDFPTAPNELTAAWLGAVTGQDITDIDTAPAGEGVGVIGMVTRVSYATAGGRGSVIVKFAAPAPENRAVAGNFDMYGREVRFYRNVAHRIPMPTPRCLAAEYDPESGDFVLVLEDLGHWRVGDQLAGATLEEAETVIDALADLHAATWNHAIEGVISHNFPAQREGIAQGFRDGWPAVLDRFGDLVPETARRHATGLANAIGPLIRRLTESDQSLVHADVRLDNILFHHKDAVLVDWQSVCTSSGEQDVAYFLTQSLPDDLRARHVDSLLQRYHARLVCGGVDGHSLGRCRDRFRMASLYLLSWAVVIAGTLDMGNDRGHALARALLGRSLNSVMDLQAFDLLYHL